MTGLLATGAPADAQRPLPRAERLGVERVVVACENLAGVDRVLRDRLCAAVVRQTRSRTAYPVVAEEGAADPVPNGAGRHELRLIVAVRGPDAVTLRLARHAFVQTSDASSEHRVALTPTATASDRALDAALAPALDTLFPRAPRRAGNDSRQY